MADIDWEQLKQEAKRRFGVAQFRPGQQELIDAVMRGRDVLGILPTGAGKSLAYQLPARFLDGATVVVSPLIALMQDQHEKTTDARLMSVRVDSTLTAREVEVATADIADGAQLIFVTPERLENPAYVALLKQRGIARVVIDEAHCVSQWGHDFRPAYLSLRDAIRRLGRPPVLALTATAPAEVAADILRQLEMKDAEIVNTGADRPNLMLQVFRTPTEASKREQVLRLLRDTDGPAIVYAATIKTVEELYAWLKERKLRVTLYHGERRAAEREEAQNGFMENRYRIVVATKAFGLGIDKPDIRLVLHYQFPDSPETYYQEAGRAGRDGQPARAVLLYRLEDRRVQSYFLSGKYPRREESQRVYDALTAASQEFDRGLALRELVERTNLSERRVKVLVAQLEELGILRREKRRLRLQRRFRDMRELENYLREYEQRYAAQRQRLEAMMRYAQSTLCRMRYLRNYLGEETEQNCGHCDNCRNRSARPKLRRRRTTPIVASDRQFRIGQRVYHARFGEGEVLDGGGEHFKVNFPRAGVKTVLASYLKSGR